MDMSESPTFQEWVQSQAGKPYVWGATDSPPYDPRGLGASANLLTVADVATRAGIASSTWRAYVSRGQAPRPVTRVGREPLWDAEMVEEWLAGRRERHAVPRRHR
jgi:predicted DNA-binding transcriptional regulator AlpA